MIEILNIYFLSTCLLVIFSFPFSNRYASNIIKIKKINIFEIYLLNTIFTTSILLILSFFRIDLTILFFVILICSLINLFFIEYGKFKKDLILFFFFFLFIVIFFTKIANYPVLEWDGFSHWIYKVKNFYDGYSYKNFSNVQNHHEYPPLGSYLWAFVWKGSLINNEYTGRVIYLYFYFLSLFLIISKTPFNLIVKILIIALLTIITFDVFLFSGYQEPLNFSLMAICLFLFIKIKDYNKFTIFHLFLILACNLIAWTKSEGVFLILFLYIFVFFDLKINKKSKVITFFILMFIFFLKNFIDLNIYDSNFNAGFPSWFTFVAIENFFNYSNFIERSSFLIANTLMSFFKYPIFIFFLIFMLLNFLNRKFSKFDFLNLAFFLFTLIAINMIFLLDSSYSWKFKAQVGLDRILYSTSSVYLFFIIKSLTIIFKKKLGKEGWNL